MRFLLRVLVRSKLINTTQIAGLVMLFSRVFLPLSLIVFLTSLRLERSGVSFLATTRVHPKSKLDSSTRIDVSMRTLPK